MAKESSFMHQNQYERQIKIKIYLLISLIFFFFICGYQFIDCLYQYNLFLFLAIRKRKSGHKEHFCLFCGKRTFKLPRHCDRRHKEESEVKEALSFPKKSKNRRLAWSRLARKGDYDVNLNALKDHRDLQHIAVVRKSKGTVDDFVPCPHCFGFFKSDSLYRHAKFCQMKSSEQFSNRYLQTGRTLLCTAITDGKFQDVHTLLLSKMKRDALHLVIRNDQDLLLYGAVQLQKKEKDRYSDIRYSLRCLAKLLVEFRECSVKPSARSVELVMPENFDKLIQAAKAIAGYNGPRDIKTPTTFLKLGFCIRNLAVVLRAVALRECADTNIQKLRNFIELYETDWQIFASNARATHNAVKANAPEELPVESDVKLFRAYVMNKMKELVKKIKENRFDVSDLRTLSKVTLARVMTFNARRGGEVSKLKLIHWAGVEDGRWKRRTDLNALDDPVEKILAERLQLCYLEGKKKKGAANALVPVLFTEETVEAIRLLIKHRNSTAPAEGNDYIFACGDLYLRGWDTLQGITKQIQNLRKPQLITPTRTRKLLATMLQLLDMNDAELTWLTNHFGHTKGVHKGWYRKEDSTIELTKVARVLVAVDGGEVIKNKRIDDVMSKRSCVPLEDTNNCSSNVSSDEGEIMLNYIS